MTESTIISNVKSTHKVDTFILRPEHITRHQNADSLSIVRIPGMEYTCIIKTDDWKDKLNTLVAYVQPDSIVDVKRPEFAFLGEKGGRIKAKKLRGVVSFGLLVPAEGYGLKEGDCAKNVLAVEHYDPEEAAVKNAGKRGLFTGGEVGKPPSGVYPKYDVENAYKYAKTVFNEGEVCYVSLKIHGANGRFVFQNSEFFCGSRGEWKKEYTSAPKITLEELIEKTGDKVRAEEIYNRNVVNFKSQKNMWWKVLDETPKLKEYLVRNPGVAVYGEVYGQIQKGFPYDCKPGESKFRAFDILKEGQWLGAEEFIRICDENEIPRVPLIGFIPFNFEKLVELSQKSDVLNSEHLEEGIVIKPLTERWHEKLGRVSLKLVNPKFLESS